MRAFILFTFLFLLLNCKGQYSKVDVSGIKKELFDIYQTDQLYRAEMAKVKPTDLKIVELVNKQDSLDSINVKRVIVILDSMGYPLRSQFGDSAGLAAFFVIQHANLNYQDKYLPLFEQAARNNEIEWKNVVYMIDRVRLKKGQKQLFGTQIQPLKDPKTGYLTDKAEVAPIEDEKNVNTRRAKIELGTIEDYAKQFGIKYKPKE